MSLGQFSKAKYPPSVKLKAAAELELRRRASSGGTSAPSLAAFVEQTTQVTLEPWQHIVCDRLARLPDEQGQRILIHGPPQFGKVADHLAALPGVDARQEAAWRVRLACYNMTHAERFSKVNLSIMQSAEYQAMFPDARVPDRTPPKNGQPWRVRSCLTRTRHLRRLGLAPALLALGVDTLIIDDPYKNRQEALSEATNVNLWGWWSDVVLPRMNPSTNVVVMFHRWQDNDYAGRLLEQGGWEYLRFAAIADGGDDDPMGRELGQLLSPRYPLAYLEDVKRKQGSSFYALYQGTPRAPEGDYFKRGWFEIVPRCPWAAPTCAIGTWRAARHQRRLNGGRADGAGCARLFLCGRRVARAMGRRRAQRNIKQRRRWIGSSMGVLRYIEQAPGLSKEPTEDLVRQLAGYPYLRR
jgi:hypothetical protein